MPKTYRYFGQGVLSFQLMSDEQIKTVRIFPSLQAGVNILTDEEYDQIESNETIVDLQKSNIIQFEDYTLPEDSAELQGDTPDTAMSQVTSETTKASKFKRPGSETGSDVTAP